MLDRIRNLVWRVRAGLTLAPAARCVAWVCIVVYLIRLIASRTEFVEGTGYSFSDCLTYCFGLHWPLVQQGFIWQPVTHMFLHGSLIHLLLNTLTVLLFGSGLEIEIGSRRFWRLFLLGGAVGGVGWLLADLCEPALLAWLASAPSWGGAVLNTLHLHRETAGQGICIGASGGVCALIGAFAALFPRREILVLVLFWPVPFRARTLAILLALATAVAAVLGLGQVAYMAHLAGGGAGYVYGLRLRRRWPAA